MVSVVKTKVVEMEENTREVRIRRMSKEVVGYFQDMAEKHIFLVQFKYGQKKQMSPCSLFLCVRKRRLIWMSNYLIIPKKN